MPTLTFRVPNTEWAKLAEIAQREGCDVRTLVLWKIRGAFDLPVRPQATPEPEPEQAAA